jgi:hypothetical protein
MTKATSWVANLALVVTSILVTLLFCDLLVVFINPKFSCSAKESNLYLPDAARGWALKTNLRTTVCDAGYYYTVRTNDYGFRDEAWPKKAPQQILLVGDSLTFGMPLQAEQGFAEKLQRLGEGKLAVYNAGVVGYGPPHMYEAVKLLCAEFRFDHIIYLYFFNDIRVDNLDVHAMQVVEGYLVPVHKEDGSFYREDEIRQHIREATTPRFTLMGFFTLYHLRSTLADIHVHPRQLIERLISLDPKTKYYDRYFFTARMEEYPDAQLRKATEWVVKIRNRAAQCGAKFSVVVLPTDAEAYYGLREPATDRFLPMLSEWSLHVVDLRKSTRPGQVLHIHKDGHLNDVGTSWAAGQLLAIVRGEL